jgi:hypothetical protein
LVTNNNNKCDNTLKKRNALVAFEFRSLLDRVSHHNQIDEEIKLNTEISDLLPYNHDHFNLNISHNTQSPPSLSSSSSSTTSSSNNSTSSASYSSHFQSVSPKDTWSPLYIHSSSSPRVISPTNIVHLNRQPTSASYRYENQYEHKQLKPVLNRCSQSTSSQNLRESYVGEKMRSSGSGGVNVSLNNVTIWREELNAKNNIQQQMKKKVRNELKCLEISC